MRFSVKILVFSLFIVSAVNAQELTREQKFQRIEDLKGQVKVLETQLFSPDSKDLKQAEKEGFEVFRLMPRERYDGKLIVQGGGGYYSFTTKSHDYQKTAQIELSQNNLSVGFTGADYGFIADLNDVPLSDITQETIGVNFLANYNPPTNEPEIRVEQRKSSNYEADGFSYSRRLPAKIGHSYILRAISFDNADVLVAFKIIRKDIDGSLIIFWNSLKQFENPQIERLSPAEQSQKTEKTSAAVDYEAAQKVQNAMLREGFYEVTVDVSTVPMTLRGTFSKGKLAEIIQLAQETNGGKPVRNELTEK